MSFILGLTGSIGMGKSATADVFRRLGVPVHDADAAVHALYRGRAAPLIERGVSRHGGGWHRSIARNSAPRCSTVPTECGSSKPSCIRWCGRTRRLFCARFSPAAPLVVLDIPLLFETGGDDRCDAVLVVSAPASVQAARVMAGPE